MSNNSTYYRRKALGICVFCESPDTKGTTRCDECRTKHSKETLSAYHQRMRNGQCRYCEKPTLEGAHYCEEHQEEQRQISLQRKDYNRELRRQHRKDALEMYGSCCQECGNNTRRLEFHHIDGSGWDERETVNGKNGGGHKLHERLKREGYDPNIVLLCINCHSATRKIAA